MASYLLCSAIKATNICSDILQSIFIYTVINIKIPIVFIVRLISAMSLLLKQKLMGLRPTSTNDGENSFHSEASDKNKAQARSNLLDEEEYLGRLQVKEDEHDDNLNTLRQKFLYRLAIALHSYGSSASRTEHLIERAADRLGVGMNIAVFPSLILLSFADRNDESRHESHMITVDTSLDVDKLERADDLAANIGNHYTQVLVAYWKLKVIATSQSQFESCWWNMLGFALSGATSGPLFFKGSFSDACVSLLLSLIVGILDKVSKKLPGMANLIEFTSAITVSFVARIISIYFENLQICFSTIALSSLVQLLPGLILTSGVSDMVAKSYLTGTSIIMYALFSSLQLGFGLSIGERLIFWVDNKTSSDHCKGPDMPFWWNIFWFLGYTVSSNILLNARLKQWPGMTLASGAGYIVYAFTGEKLGTNASSVLAAFAVSITGTCYSYFTGDLPLAMVLCGILLLVPGGLGVEGIQAMLADDVLSGMGFVFNMLVVGLAITIGLLMAKIILPATLIDSAKLVANDKATLAAAFEEEDMAL